ncbi:MAG: hypothetical protein JJ895_07610 [Balneolaceae bacterium]|nr:hypothetical protein [Balneolaceae bacterium]
MGHIYSKKEVSDILRKASEIQTQKDLYGDREGLTKEELELLAKEVGIDPDSLHKAIQSKDSVEFNDSFDWISGTSKIQEVAVVEGEVTEDNWDEIIREIRKVIGGIGKDSNQRNSFEWEQRLKEIGYRHISLTPKDGQTTIQYVYSWRGIRFMSNLFGFMIPSMFAAGSLADSGYPLIAFLIAGGLAGLAGVLATRLFLKPYFEKQKTLMKQTIDVISKKLIPSTASSIVIEEGAYEDSDTLSSQPTDRLQQS